MAYQFDERSTKRIARTVLGYERSVDGAADVPGRAGGQQGETCWGRLTNKVDDGWEWEEVYRDHAGNWQVIDGGRKGDETADVPLLAVELVDGTGTANAVVMLRRLNTKSEGEDNVWVPGWGIVASTPGVRWGKLTALWSPGSNTVTLQPVQDAAGTAYDEPPDPINVYIIMPVNKHPAYLLGEVDDVFAYDDLGGTYLLRNPQTTPIPVRKWEVIQNVGTGSTDSQWVADFMRAHNVVEVP